MVITAERGECLWAVGRHNGNKKGGVVVFLPLPGQQALSLASKLKFNTSPTSPFFTVRICRTLGGNGNIKKGVVLFKLFMESHQSPQIHVRSFFVEIKPTPRSHKITHALHTQTGSDPWRYET